jgi:hypothetical protein
MGAVDRRSPPLIEPASRSWRVAVALSVWQLVVHLWVVSATHDNAVRAAHLLSWLTDTLLLGGFAVLAGRLGRAWPNRARVADRTLAAIVLLLGAGLSVYPQMLRAYVQFPVNVFAADGGAIGVTVREYLGWSRLWPAAVALAIGVAVMPLRVRPTRFWGRVVASVVLGAAVLSLPRSPHPIAHSAALQIQWALAARARVVPSIPGPSWRTDDGAAAPPTAMTLTEPLAADHVFLIVLEGVTADRFEREFLPIPDGFYAIERSHAAYYSRYYATNNDSYTSLIAMLTGIQVPYRAYSDAKWFAPVNAAPSLAGAFRQRGAQTLFIGTYAYQPFVPVPGQWDEVLDRSRLPEIERWVSLGTSRMEAATEDRAALETIVDWAAPRPRTFTVQEMVYGHSSEWQERTGLSQLAYYDLFLRELRNALRKWQLDARSLIAVVADHGDRSQSAVADNYRVPLLIVGPAVVAGTRNDFLSHQDLSEILVAELTGTRPPVARAHQLVVGATDRWVYGRIDDDGESVFIDNGSGSVLASTGALDARSLFDEFQSMVIAFASRFAPRRPSH